MKTQTLEYRAEQDDATMLATVVHPDTDGPLPVVLIGHTWTGCDDFVKKQAQRVAQMGYIGFAIDMYGGGKVSDSIDNNKKLMGDLLEDRQLLRRRIRAAWEAARNLPGADSSRVGGMGYCFGGLCMLDLARLGTDVNGVVSFHGQLSNGGLPTEKISASVLVLHGEQDSFIPDEQIADFMAEMNTAEADWQMHTYCKAKHGFTNPHGAKPELGIDYDANADKRSWQAMQNFFNEVFAR